MTDEEVADQTAARLRTLADLALRNRAEPARRAPSFLGTGAGPLESFTTVIDALAAELGLPRSEVVGRLVADLKQRIDLDRATLAHLRSLQENRPGTGTEP